MAEQSFESQNSWLSKSLPVTARPPCLATGTHLQACREGWGGEIEGQNSPGAELTGGEGARDLLRLALLPGQRHPAGHEAGVPGEPQADQQDEAEQDVGLGEGEGPQLPVLFPQHLVSGLLMVPALQPAAPGLLETKDAGMRNP